MKKLVFCLMVIIGMFFAGSVYAGDFPDSKEYFSGYENGETCYKERFEIRILNGMVYIKIPLIQSPSRDWKCYLRWWYVEDGKWYMASQHDKNGDFDAKIVKRHEDYLILGVNPWPKGDGRYRIRFWGGDEEDPLYIDQNSTWLNTTRDGRFPSYEAMFSMSGNVKRVPQRAKKDVYVKKHHVGYKYE